MPRKRSAPDARKRKILMADIFAHAAGLLLLAHTGRIRMFGASAPHLMERFVDASGRGADRKARRVEALNPNRECPLCRHVSLRLSVG